MNQDEQENKEKTFDEKIDQQYGSIAPTQEQIEKALGLSAEEKSSSETVDENSETLTHAVDNLEEEKRAKQYGHVSKEEWVKQGRDADKWKTPEEFNKFGESYNEFKELKKEIQQKNKDIDTLINYHKRNTEQVVQQAKLELEQRLYNAKQIGDTEAVEKLVLQKSQVEQQQNQERYKQQQDEINQVDTDFIKRNTYWFNDEHPELKARAVSISNEITLLYPNLPYRERVNMVEQRIKYERPELNVSQANAPIVSSNQSKVSKSMLDQGTEERTYRQLSTTEKADFTLIKQMVEKVRIGSKPISYTLKDYLDQKQRFNND